MSVLSQNPFLLSSGFAPQINSLRSPTANPMRAKSPVRSDVPLGASLGQRRRKHRALSSGGDSAETRMA
eukprot:CAMPEP_0185752426 /NCGR_PEP_ID=MMETSP1174-20130828/11235_1 /TAXON_ID=35687 /ORGANISM="Dictyocha speculum, Strain CCMP1381" /LENGTH=68 /DNA_ID=CAMNT_0028429877 /DNA_START=975 /DNA_END=1182 /DNA_ORIENTATION=+